MPHPTGSGNRRLTRPGADDVPPRGRATWQSLFSALATLNEQRWIILRERRRLQARAATDRVKDAEVQVAREVRVAYLNARSAHQRLGLTAQLLAQARLALDLAQSRYELGLSSIVELSQAQLALTNAEIAGASARFEYLSRRADLSFQLGENR